MNISENSQWKKTKFPTIPNNEKRPTTWQYRDDTTKVQLYSRIITSSSQKGKHTVAFLHGLQGNGNHFKSLAEELVNDTDSVISQVLLIDLRNHGLSDHHDSFDFEELADDVKRHLDELQLDSVLLIGHSIGAKTAMMFSLKYPSMLKALIVLDTFPKDYQDIPEIFKATEETIDALLEVDLTGYKNKNEFLHFASETFGSFFTNLLSANVGVNDDKEKSLFWKINLKAIKTNFRQLIGFKCPENVKEYFTGPFLVLLGENSIHPKDKSIFKTVYPDFQEENNIIYIKNSSKRYMPIIINIEHWIHVDNPTDLQIEVSDFILKNFNI